MIHMIFGYARVSTQNQNLAMQLDAFEKYGVDEVFQEKMSGAKKDRPELEKMIDHLRKGDKVVVYKLHRISRSTKHLIALPNFGLGNLPEHPKIICIISLPCFVN